MPNREERRKLEKKGRLERGDLIRITREISYKATNDAFRLFVLTAVFALRDEFSFGESRINRFIGAVNRKVNEYNEGLFTIEDMEEAMQLEVGYESKKIAELKRKIRIGG